MAQTTSDDGFLGWLDRVDQLLRDQHDMTLAAVPPGVPLRVRYDAGDSPGSFVATAAAEWLEPPWRPGR
jgi:hypothetical protein